MAMAPASRLQLLLLLLAILGCDNAGAQQTYNEADQLGYVCSGTDSCQAYAAYRALPSDATLKDVGSHFGLSAEQVADASRLPTSASVSAGQLLLVPLNCSCLSGRSRFNTTYVIQKYDTMYLVSLNVFEGLTTWQAVEAANPSVVPTQMQPGDKIIFPIRCACPSASQRQAGVRSLVTYSIGAGDTVALISSNWNLSTSDVVSENKDTDLPASIRPNTTLLLPVKSDPPALSTRNSSTPSPASPAPTASSPPAPNGSSSRLSTGAVVGIAVAAAAGAAFAAVVMLCVWRGKRKGDRVGTGGSLYFGDTSRASAGRDTHYSNSYDVSADLNNSKKHRELMDGMADMLDSEKPIVFSYTELSKATDGFSPRHRIQGSVYRGVVGGQTVAIKEMKSGATSQELRILAKVHHMNLVRLIGLCSGGDRLFFVYEYAENGSLNNYLQGTAAAKHKEPASGSDSASASSTAPLLNWNTRLQIALDVASGLEYIHDYTKPSFVHKDIKSTNILLDSNFRAKIANFGMARLIESRDGSSIPPAALTSHVTGTQGYLAPEYLAHGFVSPKLDVFAFGVVLLELITGREAVLNDSGDTRSRFLSDVFVGLMQGGDPETKLDKIKQWLDPSLDQAVPWDILYSLVLLARSCVDEDPAARPNMKDVTYALSQMVDSSVQWETERTLDRRYNSGLMQGR